MSKFAQTEVTTFRDVNELRAALRGDTPVRVRFTKNNGDGAEAMLTHNPALVEACGETWKEPEFSKSFIKAFCVERGRWTTVTFAQMGIF